MSDELDGWNVEAVLKDRDGAAMTVITKDGSTYACVSEEGISPSAIELSSADLINLGSLLLNLGRRLQEEGSSA